MMTKTQKHTPGLWRNPKGSVSVFAGHNQKVCDTAWFNRTVGEAEANAEFICRAVNCHAELLAACKSLMTYANLVRELGKSMDGVCNNLNVQADIEQAQAAIDKAEP